MAAKKKILHLITGLELGGGAENMLLNLLPKMQKRLENRVCVIKGKGEIGKKLEKEGIRVYYLELRNIFDFGAIFRYRKLIREFRPEIQVNYLIHADIFGRIFGKIFGIKKVVSYIRNIHRCRKFLMFFDRNTLFLADFVLTNSETAKKYYINKMGARNQKIMCIPNGIDMSKFENLNVNIPEKKKEIGIPENGFVIGCVARLEKQKDVLTLLRAFNEVQKSISGIHLLLVGHGREKEKLAEYAKKLGVSKETIFLDKREDMPEIYKIMDIFVLPSLNEGMSNALLEAMSSGIPAITSDIEENQELIENGFNGLNFGCGNYLDLAKKIEHLLKNTDKRRQYSKESLKIAEEKYNLNRVVQKFQDLLESF